MNTKDLEKLPPKERIKKLKQLEQEHMREIQEAERLIVQSEAELAVQKQLKEGLAIKDDDSTQEDEEKKKREKKKEELEESLEEVLETHKQIPKAQITNTRYQLPTQLPEQEAHVQYVIEQSQRPLEELQGEMDSIYHGVKERGYMTWDEQSRVATIYSALDEKLRASDAGEYSMTQEVAQQAHLAKSLTGRLLDNAYSAHKGKREAVGKELYQK